MSKSKVYIAAGLLVGSLPALGGYAAASEPLAMDFRVDQFATPLMGTSAGADMPAYFAWSQNTKFSGDEARVADTDLVSNTVTYPRSSWGGAGADEWRPALGVIAGGLDPYPSDESAEDFYAWTGVDQGSVVSGGNDIGMMKLWYTSVDTAAIDYQPSGRAGSLAWASEDRWRQTLHATTRAYATETPPDGSPVRSRASYEFTRAMYLNHARISASGGDVSAASGAVTAPPFAFRSPTPPGTVMNLQLVGYSIAGPWKDATLSFDFNAGTTSAPTGEWRLPVNVQVKQGGFIPERRDDPRAATPQFTIPMTALGIPLLPENAGAGANDTYLVLDVQPDDAMRYVLALRQPDGSTRVQTLRPDGFGQHMWRVDGGELIEVTPTSLISQPAGVKAPKDLVSDSADILSDSADILSGSTDLLSDSAVTATSPAPNKLALSAEIAIDAPTGRPILRNLERDGRRILDSYDIARAVTPDGTFELGSDYLQGRAIVWSNARGTTRRGSAAYVVDDRLLVVSIHFFEDRVLAYVSSHSLTGRPLPLKVESDADLSGQTPLNDAFSGPVQRGSTFAASELKSRLLLSTGGPDLKFGPSSLTDTTITVHDRGQRPTGAPLTDPVATTIVTPGDAWTRGVTWLWSGLPEAQAAPIAGSFTGVHAYRYVPTASRGSDLGLGGVIIEENKDLRGDDTFGLAFKGVRADGTRILMSQVQKLYISMLAADGTELFAGNVTPNFTPDGGQTWGAVFVPNGRLPSMDVIVYARATYQGGMLARESSPSLSIADWTLRFDRIDIGTVSVGDGSVAGTTAPLAAVIVSIPELGISNTVQADAQGAFAADLNLAGTPDGEYEVVVNATSPRGETGGTSLRLRQAPGPDDPLLHGSTIDVASAEEFLLSRAAGGAFDSSLRSTAAAVAALEIATPSETVSYLASLASDNGSSWRNGEMASAAATGLAAGSLSALGESVAFDPHPFLRMDGSADAATGAKVSSLEAVARLVIGLQESGNLAALDPWRASNIRNYLRTAVPKTAQESYERATALSALGEPAAATIEGEDLDAAAYRVLVGADPAEVLAPFQITSGGFTLRRYGTRTGALPTALALRAVAAAN